MHLTTEYTDIKDVKHNVEHLTLPADDKDREQIVAELLNALTKPGKRISA